MSATAIGSAASCGTCGCSTARTGWSGALLVADGAVEARSYPPDTGRDDELDTLERAARDDGAGIWGAC